MVKKGVMGFVVGVVVVVVGLWVYSAIGAKKVVA